MECRDTERLIDTYMDNELSPTLLVQLEAHLAECALCRKKYSPMLELLRSPMPVSVPAGLRDRVVTVAFEQRDRRDIKRQFSPGGKSNRRFLRMPWLGAAAACLTFFVVGWLSSRFLVKPAQQPVVEVEKTPQEPAVTIVLSPWILNSWAQAMTLRGPANPLPLFVQAAVTEMIFESEFDTTPAIRVRRQQSVVTTTRPDTSKPQPDSDPQVFEMPIFVPIYRL